MQQIGDHLLTAFELRQIPERLQNPRAQFARAHRRDSSIEHGEQACVPIISGFDQLEVGLRCGIEHHEFRRRITAQRSEMIDLSPHLMLEVMNDRAGRADRRRHLRATETIERFDFKMFAQSETRVLGEKRVIVVGHCAFDLRKLLLLPIADQQLRRRNPRELIE